MHDPGQEREALEAALRWALTAIENMAGEAKEWPAFDKAKAALAERPTTHTHAENVPCYPGCQAYDAQRELFEAARDVYESRNNYPTDLGNRSDERVRDEEFVRLGRVLAEQEHER
jgi:hypothetical protein